jgi:hypothetical protein
LVRADGIIELALGMYPGSTGDTGIYKIENFEDRLEQMHNQVAAAGNDRPYILSDSAFTTTTNNVTPFAFDPQENNHRNRVFSMLHSATRIGAEWGFAKLKNLWRGLNLKESMRALWNFPERRIVVAIMLTNLVVCCEGSQHSSYFGVSRSATTCTS